MPPRGDARMADLGHSPTVDRSYTVRGSVGIASGLSAGALVVALFMAGTLSSMPVLAESTSCPSDRVNKVGTTVLALDPSRGGGVYPVFTSVDLQARNATARQAIVIVHGRLRNASDYFTTGRELVEDAGAAGRDTVVVAPQLLNQVDVTCWTLSEQYLRWDKDWEEGNPAQGPLRPAPMMFSMTWWRSWRTRRRFPNCEESFLSVMGAERKCSPAMPS